MNSTQNLNEKLLAAHNRNLRLRGVVYRIISSRIGGKVLAEADPLTGQSPRINLVVTRSALGMELRNLVNLNLFV